MNTDNTSAIPKKSKAKLWLKRLGIAGFLFFLIKGLLWLALLGLVMFGLIDETHIDQIKNWFTF